MENNTIMYKEQERKKKASQGAGWFGPGPSVTPLDNQRRGALETGGPMALWNVPR